MKLRIYTTLLFIFIALAAGAQSRRLVSVAIDQGATGGVISSTVIYAPSHGYTNDSIPAAGYIPFSAANRRANTLAADSVHTYYAISFPDRDSIEIRIGGELSAPGHGLTIGETYYLQDDGSESTTPDDILAKTIFVADAVTLILTEQGLNESFIIPRVNILSQVIAQKGGDPANPSDTSIQRAVTEVYKPAGLAKVPTVFVTGTSVSSDNPTYQSTSNEPGNNSNAWFWDGRVVTRLKENLVAVDMNEDVFGGKGVPSLITMDEIAGVGVAPSLSDVVIWLDTNYVSDPDFRLPNGAFLYWVGNGSYSDPDIIYQLADDLGQNTGVTNWERLLKKIKTPFIADFGEVTFVRETGVDNTAIKGDWFLPARTPLKAVQLSGNTGRTVLDPGDHVYTDYGSGGIDFVGTSPVLLNDASVFDTVNIFISPGAEFGIDAVYDLDFINRSTAAKIDISGDYLRLKRKSGSGAANYFIENSNEDTETNINLRRIDALDEVANLNFLTYTRTGSFKMTVNEFNASAKSMFFSNLKHGENIEIFIDKLIYYPDISANTDSYLFWFYGDTFTPFTNDTTKNSVINLTAKNTILDFSANDLGHPPLVAYSSNGRGLFEDCYFSFNFGDIDIINYNVPTLSTGSIGGGYTTGPSGTNARHNPIFSGDAMNFAKNTTLRFSAGVVSDTIITSFRHPGFTTTAGDNYTVFVDLGKLTSKYQCVQFDGSNWPTNSVINIHCDDCTSVDREAIILNIDGVDSTVTVNITGRFESKSKSAIMLRLLDPFTVNVSATLVSAAGFPDIDVADSYPLNITTYQTRMSNYPALSDAQATFTFLDKIETSIIANISDTTDGSGDLTITFPAAMPDDSYSASISNTSATPYLFRVTSKTATTMTVRVEDTSGAAVTGTAVSFDYQVTDR